MRTVRTLSIIVGLSLAGVAGFVAPAASTVTTPTLVNVRYAAHAGYDRVVFDWTGGLPSWHAAYGTLAGEGTGTPIALTGSGDLVLRFSNARAHDDQYRPTYRMTTVLDPNLTTLKQVKFGGDYEGYVSAGLGLRDVVGYRVFTLTGPFRVVVDVMHAANVVVDRIRTGRHTGFDRMVFDVRGTAVPGYQVGYVPGTTTLQVRFVSTTRYLGASPIWVGYPALRSVRLYAPGTFHARTAARHGYRVSVLTNPVRVVVDVRT